METRISLITLGYRDFDRARGFYEALGWSGQSPDGEVVFIQAGGMVLGLWDRAFLAADSGVADSGGWGGVTLAHNVRSPAEVDAVLEEAAAAGGRGLRGGAEALWGGYTGLFCDLHGHPWEAAPNPRRTIADDGTVLLPA